MRIFSAVMIHARIMLRWGMWMKGKKLNFTRFGQDTHEENFAVRGQEKSVTHARMENLLESIGRGTLTTTKRNRQTEHTEDLHLVRWRLEAFVVASDDILRLFHFSQAQENFLHNLFQNFFSYSFFFLTRVLCSPPHSSESRGSHLSFESNLEKKEPLKNIIMKQKSFFFLVIKISSRASSSATFLVYFYKP